MRFKSFKIGKTDEKPEEETVQEEAVTVDDVVDMEEKIASKTKKLKDAEEQLKGLTDSTKGSEEDDDEMPGPHGPLIELTVEPGGEIVDLETESELNNLMDTDEKDKEQNLNIVELGDKNTVKVVDKTADKAAGKHDDKTDDKAKKNEKTEQSEDTKPNEKSEPEKEAKPDAASLDSGDGFSDLFSDEEEDVNPLANLINNLPEVSAQELINELEELKEIIKERQQG